MRRIKRRIADKLVWDGRSVFWTHDYNGGIPGGDSNLWMCAQDAGTAVWWYFHSLEKSMEEDAMESLRLEDCSDELRDVLIASLPYNQYRANLLSTVARFAQVVAQTLVLDGRISFEIKGGWNRNVEPERLEEAALAFMPTKSLIYIGSKVFQKVPQGAESDDSPDRIVRLDSKRVVKFDLLRHWRRPIARIRRCLPKIGRSERKWMSKYIEHRGGEDFNTVKREYNVKIAQITAPLGWNARGLFREEIADFQWVTRELRWKKFCIDLRDGILRTLGDAFQQIGQLKGEKPKLVWENLPTVEQIEEALQLVINGKTRFDSILKQF